MRQAIVTAAREFCRRTRWVRETIYLNAQAEVTHYPLLPFTPCHEVVAIRAAMFRDEPMVPAGPEQVPSKPAGTARGHAWYFEPPATMVVLDAPEQDETDAFAISTVIQPRADSRILTDALVHANDQALADGALAYLLGQRATNWFEPNQSQVRRMQFDSAIGAAQYRADSQHRPRGFHVRTHV